MALAVLLGLLGPAKVNVDLSEEQRTHLEQLGEVPYCVDPDWRPFEVINAKGEHVGLAADLVRLAAERAGVSLRLVQTADWDESVEASRAGRCRFLSFLNETPRRQEWLVFTKPLYTDVNVFITREEHPFIADPLALSGASIALPRGTSVEERVRRDFPNLTVIQTDSEADALRLVSERKATLTMRSLTVAAYVIKQEGWFNLKIAGQVPGYDNLLRIGVSKEDPVLREILDAGIQTITPEERGEIVNRHISITVETAIDYGMVWRVLGISGVVLLTSAFWIKKLRGLNQRLERLSRTDALTGLANRVDLNEHLATELQRAERFKHPFSVMIVDIDHFKIVNDELGHLAGDRVLVEFAKRLKGCVRSADLCGRWGGEEFQIICPETDAQKAMILAERLLDAIRCHPFSDGRKHTASVGAATFIEGDTLASLLSRADDALYRAKGSGRDRACA